MSRLGSVPVGGSNPVRLMGIINTSPESFYKKSVFTEQKDIANTVRKMEEEGADIIDVGGMSTAPYLKTMISENAEIARVRKAISIIQKVSRLPISIDTCRASVAKAAFDQGVEILNDVSGLKYDKNMTKLLERYGPSVILCAFGDKTFNGNQILLAKNLIGESIAIAKRSGILKRNIVIDPAVGFFRKEGKSPFFTRINSDWLRRDIQIIKNLNSIKNGYPILVSLSRKSFIGALLNEDDPEKRLYGSLAAEVIATMNGADVIRTHNVKATRDAIAITQKLSEIRKSL